MQQPENIIHYIISLQRELGITDNAAFLEFLGISDAIALDDFESIILGEAVAGDRVWRFFESVTPITLATPEDFFLAFQAISPYAISNDTIMDLRLKSEVLKRRAETARKNIVGNMGYSYQDLYPHIHMLNLAHDEGWDGSLDVTQLDFLAESHDRGHGNGNSEKKTWRDRAKEVVAALPPVDGKISPEQLKRFAAALSDIMNARNADGKVIFGEICRILRLTQDECLLAFGNAAEEGESTFNAEVAGGVGKTTLSVILGSAAKAAGMRTLIVVPSKLAVDGTYEEFRKMRPDISVGRIYQGRHETTQDVVVITYASLAKEFHRFHLDMKKKGFSSALDLSNFQLTLADEGHGYITKLSKQIFGSFISLLISYSATHYFRSDKQLGMNFGKTVYKLPFLESVRRGDISPEEWRRIEVDAELDMLALKNAQQNNGELTQVGQQLLNNSSWNDTIAELYKCYVDKQGRRIFGEKSFVMCGGTDHANEVARVLNEKLMPLLKEPEFRAILEKRGIDPDKVKRIAMPMHRKLPEGAPEAILEAYERDEVLMLVSVKLLIQSVDSPRTSVIFNAFPIFSLPFAGQRGLRGSRMLPPELQWFKDRFIVFDMIPKNAAAKSYHPMLFAHYAYDAVGVVSGLVEKPVIECHSQPPIKGVARIDTEWDPYDISVLEKASGPMKGKTGKTKEEHRNDGFIRLETIDELIDKTRFVQSSASWVTGHLTLLARQYTEDDYGSFVLPLTHGQIEGRIDNFNGNEIIYVRADDAKAYLERMLPGKNDNRITPEEALIQLMRERSIIAGDRFPLMHDFNQMTLAAVRRSGMIGYGPVEIETEFGLIKGSLLGKNWDTRLLYLDAEAAQALAVNYLDAKQGRVTGTGSKTPWMQRVKQAEKPAPAASNNRFIRIEDVARLFDRKLNANVSAIAFTMHIMALADQYKLKESGAFNIVATNGEIDCKIEVTEKGEAIFVCSADVTSYMLEVLKDSAHELSAADIIKALIEDGSILAEEGQAEKLEARARELLAENLFVGIGVFPLSTIDELLNVKVVIAGENNKTRLLFEAESGKEFALKLLAPQLEAVQTTEEIVTDTAAAMVRLSDLPYIIGKNRYRSVPQALLHVQELAETRRPEKSNNFYISTTHACIHCNYRKEASGEEVLYVQRDEAIAYICQIVPKKDEKVIRAENVINDLLPTANLKIGKTRFSMMGMLDNLVEREMRKHRFSGFGVFEADTDYGYIKARALIGTRGERVIGYDAENGKDIALCLLTGKKIVRKDMGRKWADLQEQKQQSETQVA